MTKEYLAEYLSSIVRPLAQSGDVSVEMKSDDMGLLLTLTVPDNDFGKVIGRGGDTIKAIRTVLAAVGMTNKMRVSIKVNDPSDERLPVIAAGGGVAMTTPAHETQSDKELVG